MKTIASLTTRSSGAPWRADMQTGAHALVADEPATAGGQDAGPSPYGYILAGLGACTAMTLRMYAQRKGWDLGEVQVALTLRKDDEGATHIARELTCSAPLDEEQWQRLLDIAGKTPVTRTLMAGSAITTRRAAP